MNIRKKLKFILVALTATAFLGAPNSWAETQVPEDMVFGSRGTFSHGY